VGQAQGRAPTQKHYLKSYSKHPVEILRSLWSLRMTLIQLPNRLLIVNF